jgi:hypothetical protein
MAFRGPIIGQAKSRRSIAALIRFKHCAWRKSNLPELHECAHPKPGTIANARFYRP